MFRIWFNRTFSSVRTLCELIRQGDTQGDFQLLCTHPRSDFPGFAAAHAWTLEPAELSGEAYVDFCLAFCRKQRVDALWAGKAAEPLAAHQADFAAAGVRLLTVAEARTLALLHDKAAFYARTQGFSVPPPAFRCITSGAEFEPAYAALRAAHPVLCIKPAEGVNGTGFRVIDEQRGGLELLLGDALHSIHLDGLHDLLRTAEQCPPLLLMEYLDGVEYSVDAVADGHRLIALVQRQKATPGGYCQQIVAVPAVEQAVSEMVVTFGLRGLFNVQFREGRTGLRLLEINPRFSGGIGYTALAGINLPYLALRGLLLGFEEPAYPALSIGAQLLEVPRFYPLDTAV